MATVETAEAVDQVLDNMRRLSQQEQRMLASEVLNDRRLEAFVEEIDDHLACESAADEGTAERLDLNSRL
jgi:hypothetical protein